jgi:fucose permease
MTRKLISIFLIVAGCGVALAPTVIGVALEHGWVTAFLVVCAGFIVVGAVVGLFTLAFHFWSDE